MPRCGKCKEDVPDLVAHLQEHFKRPSADPTPSGGRAPAPVVTGGGDSGSKHGAVPAAPKYVGEWASKLEEKTPWNKTAGLNLHRALLSIALRLQKLGLLPGDALKDYDAKATKPNQIGANKNAHWNSVLLLTKVIAQAREPAASPEPSKPELPITHLPAPTPAAPSRNGTSPHAPPQGIHVGDEKNCLVCEGLMRRGEDLEWQHRFSVDQAKHDKLVRYRNRGPPTFTPRGVETP